MKKLSIIGLFILALISFNSCETEDDVVFTTQEPIGFVFTNSIQDNYILSPSTSANLGERFTWASADFGTPTNITYELQSSIAGDFSDAVVEETSIDNEIALTIGKMLTIAQNAGLDNTPGNNTGSFSVRLRAFPGDTGNGTEAFSNVLVLNVELLEQMDTGGGSNIMPSTWGIVGSGYNDWGNAGLDGVFYTTSEDNVFVAYANLIDGEIKFRENNDWPNNFGDTGADGTLDAGGDNIAVTAGSYKITMNLNDNTYSIEPFTWGVVGSGYNDWGNDGPDAKFFYDYTTDTFKVGVKLVDGEIKFRLNNDWPTNFGDTGADGTLDDGGDNIAVTAGFYNITLDFNNNTYTIESGNVWGIVGSGYNDWGNAGPDFSFTQVNPDIYVAEIATLLDGEIKFRVNEDWPINFGDTGADGTLDDGGDNIAVTAGLYRIMMNLTDNSYSLNKIQ